MKKVLPLLIAVFSLLIFVSAAASAPLVVEEPLQGEIFDLSGGSLALPARGTTSPNTTVTVLNYRWCGVSDAPYHNRTFPGWNNSDQEATSNASGAWATTVTIWNVEYNAIGAVNNVNHTETVVVPLSFYEKGSNSVEIYTPYNYFKFTSGDGVNEAYCFWPWHEDYDAFDSGLYYYETYVGTASVIWSLNGTPTVSSNPFLFQTDFYYSTTDASLTAHRRYVVRTGDEGINRRYVTVFDTFTNTTTDTTLNVTIVYDGDTGIDGDDAWVLNGVTLPWRGGQNTSYQTTSAPSHGFAHSHNGYQPFDDLTDEQPFFVWHQTPTSMTIDGDYWKLKYQFTLGPGKSTTLQHEVGDAVDGWQAMWIGRKLTGNVFSDAPFASWYGPYVSYLYLDGVFNGYPDGTFRPGNSLTRAEASKVLYEACGFKPFSPTTPTFSDVPSTAWFYKYVESLVKKGIVSGYPDGTFRPGNSVTRAEFAKLVCLAYNFSLEPTPTAPPFTDVPTTHWAVRYIQTLKKAGILSGYPDGTFRPGNLISRAETTKVLWKPFMP